jgi:MerR family transcriptional regulator, light-induced transcriptional regulator
MARRSGETEYSIASVSKLTGVSCHALRVWERRYGYPLPRRSPTNQRRYGIDQVLVLRELADLVRSGRHIGELIAEFKGGRLEGERVGDESAQDNPPVTTEIIDTIASGDIDAMQSLIDATFSHLAPAEILAQVIEPIMIEIGERWFRGDIEVYQQQMASGILLRTLGRMLDAARRDNVRPSHRAIVAGLQGEHHEGGVLMLSIMLELAGWRTLPLGVDLPTTELRKAADVWKPDAIGVSFVLSRSINKRFRELATITGVPIFVGGRSMMNHRSLARSYGLIPLVGSISKSLPQWLERFSKRRGGKRGGDALAGS